jgi:hypothetical protein
MNLSDRAAQCHSFCQFSHAPQGVTMGIVPPSAEPEPNAVAEMVRGAEHLARGDYDALGQAGLEQFK